MFPLTEDESIHHDFATSEWVDLMPEKLSTVPRDATFSEVVRLLAPGDRYVRGPKWWKNDETEHFADDHVRVSTYHLNELNADMSKWRHRYDLRIIWGVGKDGQERYIAGALIKAKTENESEKEKE